MGSSSRPLTQKVRDLVVAARRLDDADHRDGFEIELAHRRRRRAESCPLPPSIMTRSGSRLALVELPAVAAKDGLVHRGQVVRALDGLDAELAVLGAVHLAVLADDHPGDVLRARDVRDVERLDARREARQLEHLLQLFEHALHVGLQARGSAARRRSSRSSRRGRSCRASRRAAGRGCARAGRAARVRAFSNSSRSSKSTGT